MPNTAILVDSLSKAFKLPHERTGSLKQTVLNWRQRQFEELTVLKNISFEVKCGQFLGIIGRNGSGKSTLLKTIAGIYQPDSGGVLINGQLTPFIELGIGFNPELTGRDNVFLNGVILGLTRREIIAKYDEIVAFAELEQFMDQKLKNYSSGMQVRLAFSIAIQAHSDILLIDEVLAVGDENFQQKCFDVFRKLKKQKKTVIFVSHDLDSIEKFCDLVVLIEKGKVLMLGKPTEVIMHYKTMLSGKPKTTTPGLAQRAGSGSIRVLKVETFTGKTPTNSINERQNFSLKITYKAAKTVKEPVFGIGIINSQGNSIIGPNTKESNAVIETVRKGSGKLWAHFDINPLAPGRYTVTASCFDHDLRQLYDFIERIHSFNIIGKERHGSTNIEARWQL